MAIHKDKDFCKYHRESEDKYLGYYLNAYKNPNTFYEDIEPCIKSEILYKLEEILFIDDRQDVIDILRNNGINSILVNNIEN